MVNNYDLKQERQPLDEQLQKISNRDFLNYLMDRSPTGALSEIFSIMALDIYSTHCFLHSTQPVAIIDEEAWKKTVMFIKDSFDMRYKRVDK